MRTRLNAETRVVALPRTESAFRARLCKFEGLLKSGVEVTSDEKNVILAVVKIPRPKLNDRGKTQIKELASESKLDSGPIAREVLKADKKLGLFRFLGTLLAGYLSAGLGFAATGIKPGSSTVLDALGSIIAVGITLYVAFKRDAHADKLLEGLEKLRQQGRL